ncbi:MAG: hypothetical protein KJ634_13565 [Gammaproteobacteria bacterium]|nr:hypothetical protein [Gammaproteobacteria bacterium]MBU1416644.1 hypothetical protein [Gammaproteobacteria bacterium]
MKRVLAVLVVSAGLVGAAGAAEYSVGLDWNQVAPQTVANLKCGSFADCLRPGIVSSYNEPANRGQAAPMLVAVSLSKLDVARFETVSNGERREVGGPISMVSARDNRTDATYLNADVPMTKKLALGKGIFGDPYAYAANAVAVSAPEPGGWTLVLSGIALIGAVIRRRSNAHNA